MGLNYIFWFNANDYSCAIIVPEGKLKAVDKWAYATYFGFSQAQYSCILGVPEEKPGAVAFFKIKRWRGAMSTKNCTTNFFGEKDVKSKMIEEVPDAEVRNHAFNFP